MSATPRQPQNAEPLALEYEGVAASLWQARSDITDWLRDRGCDDDSVERAVLIASELATNAIQAAPGAPFTVLLESVSPHHVELTIANPNADTSIPPGRPWTTSQVLAPQGRGLGIVDALSDDVAARIENGSVVVTARIRTTSLH